MKAQSMERQRKGHTPNPQTSSKPPPLWGGFPRMKRGSGFSFDSFGSVEFYVSTEYMEYMEKNSFDSLAP